MTSGGVGFEAEAEGRSRLASRSACDISVGDLLISPELLGSFRRGMSWGEALRYEKETHV